MINTLATNPDVFNIPGAESYIATPISETTQGLRVDILQQPVPEAFTADRSDVVEARRMVDGTFTPEAVATPEAPIVLSGAEYAARALQLADTFTGLSVDMREHALQIENLN